MTSRRRPTRTHLVLLLAGAALLSVLTSCSRLRGNDPPPPLPGTTVTTGGVDVHAVIRGPGADETPLTVLFLHGQSYTSRIWADRGILDAVANAGFRAVAVDLPGYGATPERPTDDTDDGSGSTISDGTWLAGLIDELGGPAKVVVVSPSMSGRYSLDYLEQYATEALAGFVPVAPVGIDDFTRPEGSAVIPAVAIWGSDDPSYTPERADRLISQLKGNAATDRTEIIEGAGHACYDDHPEEFTALLVDFLGTLGY